MALKDKVKDNFRKRDITPYSVYNVIKYSINGLRSYAREGKSILIYLFCAIVEVIFGFVYHVNGLEWILIICMLGFVLCVELLNTAIEAACDAISKEYNPLIKIAKDCGSGATFVLFITAIILNIIIFAPKIAALF